jgi:hypothetical protein
MLNFESIAEQLEADGHVVMANAIKAHGRCAADLNAALDFSDLCAKDESSSSTGAARDALEWIMRAARDICSGQELVSAE